MTRVTTERLTIETKINPAVTYINDANLDKGKQRVVRQGEAGVLARDYTVVYENGQEVDRQLTGERVVKPAVKKSDRLGNPASGSHCDRGPGTDDPLY